MSLGSVDISDFQPVIPAQAGIQRCWGVQVSLDTPIFSANLRQTASKFKMSTHPSMAPSVSLDRTTPYLNRINLEDLLRRSSCILYMKHPVSHRRSVGVVFRVDAPFGEYQKMWELEYLGRHVMKFYEAVRCYPHAWINLKSGTLIFRKRLFKFDKIATDRWRLANAVRAKQDVSLYEHDARLHIGMKANDRM